MHTVELSGSCETMSTNCELSYASTLEKSQKNSNNRGEDAEKQGMHTRRRFTLALIVLSPRQPRCVGFYSLEPCSWSRRVRARRNRKTAEWPSSGRNTLRSTKVAIHCVLFVLSAWRVLNLHASGTHTNHTKVQPRCIFACSPSGFMRVGGLPFPIEFFFTIL